MPLFNQPWLSEDEVLFDRMTKFHRDRIDVIGSDNSMLSERSSGVLVLHLIPRSCVLTRNRVDGPQFRARAMGIPALGRDGSSEHRFNADGFLTFVLGEGIKAYSQVYRDGKLEAAMSTIAAPLTTTGNSGVPCLQVSQCEHAVLSTVAGYLSFCKALGVATPICMFSALLNCKGVRICTNDGFGDVSPPIERSPLFLPEMEITTLDAEPEKLLRPWCDVLWQCCGVERSRSFDSEGTWRQ